MRNGASVSQLLHDSCVPVGAAILRLGSWRVPTARAWDARDFSGAFMVGSPEMNGNGVSERRRSLGGWLPPPAGNDGMAGGAGCCCSRRLLRDRKARAVGLGLARGQHGIVSGLDVREAREQ